MAAGTFDRSKLFEYVSNVKDRTVTPQIYRREQSAKDSDVSADRGLRDVINTHSVILRPQVFPSQPHAASCRDFHPSTVSLWMVRAIVEELNAVLWVCEIQYACNAAKGHVRDLLGDQRSSRRSIGRERVIRGAFIKPTPARRSRKNLDSEWQIPEAGIGSLAE